MADDTTELSLDMMCKQAYHDAVHDFNLNILNHVETLTPCPSTEYMGHSYSDEDSFLTQVLFSDTTPRDFLKTLKKVEEFNKTMDDIDIIKNITDEPYWSDLIKKNYDVFSVYRPSFSSPCADVKLKEENKGKSFDVIAGIVVRKCVNAPLNELDYWKKSYIQEVLNQKLGITNDVFFICDATKGNIKQDLYFADKEKTQTFYWLQTPQIIFDPAPKTTWKTNTELFTRERGRLKFAWQTAQPGSKRNYLYPEWDKTMDDEYEATLKQTQQNIEKQICSNTNSFMITTTEVGKELIPHEQKVGFYIQQPNSTKYVYADNKSSAKSSVNNIGKNSNSDYNNLAQRFISDLIKLISSGDSFTQKNSKDLIVKYTEPYMLMAKRFGDASQAAACCQTSIPYNKPKDDASKSDLTEPDIDNTVYMTNGNHALISYDRICVATGLLFLAPIVIYSLDNGFIIFTKKSLSSIDTKLASFFDTDGKLKCMKLLEENTPSITAIITSIKNKQINSKNISDIREKIKTICDININNGLKHDGKIAHIPNWLRLVKNKTTNTFLKQNIDNKKSKNEAFRLFIGLIMSLSKYLLDLEQIENSYDNFPTFIKENFPGIGSIKRESETFEKKYEEKKEEEKETLLKDLIDFDNKINVFIKEVERNEKQSDLIKKNIFDELNLMDGDFSTDESKIELLQKIYPKDFNKNMNNFNLYDAMQSKLSLRQTVLTTFARVGKVLKGKKEITETDKKIDAIQNIGNLTEINKVMGIDTFTLPAWRELTKTNYTELITLFKDKTMEFYQAVYNEQFRDVSKLTNRQLEKKSAAQQGLNILRREFGIPQPQPQPQPQSQVGGEVKVNIINRRFEAKKRNELQSIVSRLLPIVLYQQIIDKATKEKGIVDEEKITNALLKYLFTDKNITYDEYDAFHRVDNTPFVYEIDKLEKKVKAKVDNKGYVYLKSLLYSYQENTENNYPLCEEIFVGEEYKEQEIEIPLYMIFKYIPYSSLNIDNFTSFVEFSYMLPTSYYSITDYFSDPYLNSACEKVYHNFNDKANQIFNYNLINHEILVYLQSIFGFLFNNIRTFSEQVETRNIHRIFVEDNQLKHTYATLEEAVIQNDIPAVLYNYYKLKNMGDETEELSEGFKEKLNFFYKSIADEPNIKWNKKKSIIEFNIIQPEQQQPEQASPQPVAGEIDQPVKELRKRQRSITQEHKGELDEEDDIVLQQQKRQREISDKLVAVAAAAGGKGKKKTTKRNKNNHKKRLTRKQRTIIRK